MKYLKIYALIAITLSLLPGSAKSQAGDNCKYVTVLAYLRTNAEINDQIKGMFLKKVKTKNMPRYAEFNLSDQIQFIGISNFTDSLLKEDCGISKELITDHKLFFKEHYFRPINSEFLSKLIEPNDSRLYLTFSKPVGSILIAAIGNLDPKQFGVNQFGLGLTMLFKFDSLGLIEHVYYYAAAYR